MVRAFTACAIALSLVIGCSQAPTAPVSVQVPNLFQVPLDQAVAELNSIGLHGVADLAGGCPICPPPDAGPTPYVWEEKPAAGTQVPKGTIVHLHTCGCH